MHSDKSGAITARTAGETEISSDVVVSLITGSKRAAHESSSGGTEKRLLRRSMEGSSDIRFQDHRILGTTAMRNATSTVSPRPSR